MNRSSNAYDTIHLNPSVSIVLPCRNEQGYIQACLQTALNQEPPEGGFEILVADGMSTDGTANIRGRWPKIILKSACSTIPATLCPRD